jgi:hypothetical protein
MPSNFATDVDSDPTLGWLEGTVSVGDAGAGAPRARFVHGTPYAAGAPIHLFAPAGVTSVAIFDAGGRRVRTFRFGAPVTTLDLAWDGRNDAHADVAPGVYFLRASGPDGASGRLVLTR